MDLKNTNDPFKPLSLLMFILLCVVVACTFTSCKSKQTVTTEKTESRIDTVYVNKTVTDTIVKEKIVTVTLPASSDQVVDDPCDEQGNLKPINTVIQSGGNKVTVYSREGRLYISSKIDSVSSVSEKEYRSKFVRDSINVRQQLETEFVQVDKTVVYVWPWWLYVLIVYGVVSTVLNLYQRFRVF